LPLFHFLFEAFKFSWFQLQYGEDPNDQTLGEVRKKKKEMRPNRREGYESAPFDTRILQESGRPEAMTREENVSKGEGWSESYHEN
jgi:hypothetical protein